MTSDYTELEQHPGTVDVSAAGREASDSDPDRRRSIDIALDAGFFQDSGARRIANLPTNDDIADWLSANINLDPGSGMPTFGELMSAYCKDQFPNDDANDLVKMRPPTRSFPAFAGYETDQLDRENVELGASPRITQSTFDRQQHYSHLYLHRRRLEHLRLPGLGSGGRRSGLPNSTKLIFPTLVDASLNPIPGETPPPGCLASLRLTFLRNPLQHMDVKSCEAQSPAIDF